MTLIVGSFFELFIEYEAFNSRPIVSYIILKKNFRSHKLSAKAQMRALSLSLRNNMNCEYKHNTWLIFSTSLVNTHSLLFVIWCNAKTANLAILI